MSTRIFSDASRLIDLGQLSFISGILFGDMKIGSIYYTLSWYSHKSKRPIKSIGSAEILEAGEAIDDGKTLCHALESFSKMNIALTFAVDSKDLFNTLTTCRNATDKSILGDASVICYEFESQIISSMVWIPGKSNLADALTKQNSALTNVLHSLLDSGRLPLSFDGFKERHSTVSVGETLILFKKGRI